MIIIDGNTSSLDISNFSNLEELLVRVSSEKQLENRVVTDVILNDELFSELYPHQSEDIPTHDLKSVEIRSILVGELAVNMTAELYKVAKLLSNGSRAVARLFRQADDDEALEMLQDTLDVARDFMSMLSVLRTEFSLDNDEQFNSSVEKLSALLSEMTEVLESEDWILLADLLEYEFVPVCEEWDTVVKNLQAKLDVAVNDEKA